MNTSSKEPEAWSQGRDRDSLMCFSGQKHRHAMGNNEDQLHSRLEWNSNDAQRPHTKSRNEDRNGLNTRAGSGPKRSEA
jgi:hypothetical protein